jgi:hypothetical protein
MDAVGRPEVTFWTQLASLCLVPVAVVVGVHWGINGVAACFVIAELIAVEIPMFVIVVRQMRVSPRTIAARLSGVAAATLAMTVACLVGRSALEAAGVGMTVRALLTIALGAIVYLPALWWLAPHVSRRAFQVGRNRVGRLLSTRRQAVLQPEHG